MKKRYESPSVDVVRFAEDADRVITTSDAGKVTPVPTTAIPTTPESLTVD